MPKPLLISVVVALGLPALVGDAHAATPVDARAFVDSIGVNTHLYYDDTAYGNFAMVKQRLQELGVRHVRDGFDPDRRGWFFDRVNSLGSAGIRSTLIACRIRGPADQVDGFVFDAKNEVRTSLDALEGANEPDLTGPSDWVADTKRCQSRLYGLARDDSYGAPLSVPIVGPSVSAHRAEAFGDVGAYGDPSADVGNFHPYPGGRNPSGPDYYPFRDQADDVLGYEFPGRSVPIWATETGYHDAIHCSRCGHHPASQRAVSVYVPRLLMEYAGGGVDRTFLYELVDEHHDAGSISPENNFGLFESDFSYKPSASALKNTISLLDSPSASARSPLAYTLTNTADPDGSGPGGAVRDRLLQKADGSWWLALWQDSKVWDPDARSDISNPPVSVEVTLDRTLDITGHLPTRGTETYGSLRGQSFTAGVGDDLLLVELR